MRKAAKGHKKFKSEGAKSRCAKDMSQTTEQKLTDLKADIQQSPHGNNNLWDGKRKNEVERDDTAANRASLAAQINRENKSTRRGKQTVKQRSTVVTKLSWSGLVEDILEILCRLQQHLKYAN